MTTSETVRTAATVRLEGDGIEHEYTAPADLAAVDAAFAAVMGASPVRRIALDVDTTYAAALALAVLIDETRRDALLALAAGTPAVMRGIVLSQVAPLVDTVAARSPGVTSLVASAIDTTQVDLSAACDEIVQLGLAEPDGERFVPSGPVRELAPRCLHISARADIGARRVAQFGVHDVLVAHAVGDRLTLATTSAATIASDARAFLARER